MNESVRAELLRLEQALAARDPAGVEGGLADLIADDFIELGASGRVWDARSTRELLEGGPVAPVSIEAFDVAEIGDGVVLATYVVQGSPTVSRSSLWVRRDGHWVIRFHQGSPRPSRSPG